MHRVDTKLSVNLNKVALLRNQRDVGYPSVIDMARIVVDAGAHGVTVHPRPDERHVRRSDVRELAAFVAGDCDEHVEFNVEGNPTDDFMRLVLEVLPTQATLVPDSPEQRTSDHGWDFTAHGAALRPIVAQLRDAGIRVSLFVDPDLRAVEGAAASAYAAGNHGAVLQKFVRSASEADRLGLGVNAGHDLTLANLPTLRAAMPMLAEVSIGHAITADALRIGFAAAVRAYLAALQ
jgi:pyridoxine 5-phosphate synthase